MGQNPPDGAQIFFHLKDVPEELVTFEILDESGEVLRTYATDAWTQEAGDENYSKLKDLKAGLNRFALELPSRISDENSRHHGVRQSQRSPGIARYLSGPSLGR